jgi:hypothetical protein
MTVLVPDGGEVIALEYLVNKNGQTEDLVYRLYSNNITPSETDVVGAFTEAAGGGYAAKPLTGANWVIVSGNPAVASYARQDWVFSGPLTTNPNIYGYYVTRLSTGDLVYAEKAAAVATPTNSGDEYRVVPRISAD